MTGARTYRDTCNYFDELTERLHNEMYTITNTHRLIKEAVSLASTQLQQNETKYYEESISEVRHLDLPRKTIESLVEDFESGSYQQRISEVTINNLNKAEQFNASAILIYSHAHFEICLDNILSISTFSHKDSWYKEISNQNIKIEDLVQGDLDDLLTEKVLLKLQKIEKEGLKTKLELLFRLFKPSSDQPQPKEYKYSSKVILEIDNLRHRVVHESPLVYDCERLKKDTKYLNMTVLYFIMILYSSFTLKRIPKEYNYLFDAEGNEIKNG